MPNYYPIGEQRSSIQDFGIGISKEDQQLVFEKFYRTGESSNTRDSDSDYISAPIYCNGIMPISVDSGSKGRQHFISLTTSTTTTKTSEFSGKVI